MIYRIARVSDATELKRLNDLFNGEDCASREDIATALASPGAELVLVAQDNGVLTGFCCAQVIRSMCYDEPCGQITELYVDAPYRRRGVAGALIALAQERLAISGVREVTLLTGEDNTPARRFYESAGYEKSGEIHYEKQLPDSPEPLSAK